jgi:hypothetical protein
MTKNNLKLSNNRILQAILLFISLIVMAYLFYKAWNGISEIQTANVEFNGWAVLWTVPLYLLATINSSLIWADMCKTFGLTGSIKYHASVYLSTLAARRLPGPYMNVVSRVGIYKRDGVEIKKTTFVSGVEILFVIWTGLQIVILSGVALAFNTTDNIYLAIVGFIFLTVLFHPKVLNALYRRVAKTDMVLPVSYKKIIIWWVAYIFQWLIGTFFHFQLLRSIWPTTMNSFLPLLSAWSVSGVAGIAIGIIPSGLGVSDVSFSVVLSRFVPLTIASLLAVLSRVLFTVFDVVLSVICLLVFKPINPKELLLWRKEKANL